MSRAIIIGTMIFFILFCAAYYVFYRSFMPPIQSSELTRAFFDKSMSEQMKQFSNYSIEEQYELLLYGNQTIHPPQTGLITAFARQGAIVVPFIKDKLENTQDDLTIRDIICTFEELAHLKLYDFSKDQELMELIEKRANNIKSNWKDVVCRMVFNIKKDK